MVLSVNSSNNNMVTQGATSVATTVAPTVANTVLVAIVQTVTQTTQNTVTSMSGGGLTWTLRSKKQNQLNGGAPYQFDTEVWWAVAPTTAAVTVTAQLSQAVPQFYGAGITVLAIAGVQNTANPWDGNSTLPHLNTYASSSTPSAISSGAFSTTSNAAMIISAEMDTGGGTNPTFGAGMTGITANTTPFNSFVEVKVVSAAGAQTAPWGGSEYDWQVVTDAITGDVATVSVTGTVATALTRPSQSVSGAIKVSGSATTNLRGSPGQSVSGAVYRFTGTITTSLSRPQISASGLMQPRGSITTSLQRVSQRLTAPGNVNGTVQTSLSKASFSVQAFERFVGTINTALSRVNSTQGGLVGREIFTGTITTSLTRVSMSAIAEERFVGTIRTKLGTANTLVTTNVKGLLIIIGNIYTNLYPPDLVMMGAKLGAPGQGQWYSYRYLDSGSS